MKTNKRSIKKILSSALIMLVATVMTVISSPAIVSAAPYIYGNAQKPNGVDSSDINSIHDDLDLEGRAQLIWHVLSKCVKGSKDERSTDFNPAKDIVGSTEFFDYGRIGGVVAVGTGYWLENQVQNNGGDDGAIYCRQGNNKILFLAADVMHEALSKHGESFDYKKILCDGTSDGIIHYKKGNNSCNPTQDSDNYVFASGWNNHLKKLWDHAKEVMGWRKEWSLIGNYGSDTGRLLYEREAGTRCGGKVAVSGGNSFGYAERENQEPSAYHITPALKIIGQDGGEAFEFFGANNEIENTFTTSQNISDCVDLINRANSETVVDNYRNKVYVTFNDRCKNYYQNIVDTNSNVSQAAKDSFNSLKEEDAALRASDPHNTGIDKARFKFLTDKQDPEDASDTWDMQCVDIEELIHPEQSEDQSSADDAQDDLDATLSEPDCYSNAGALGWVLCPIINQGGDFVVSMYEKFIEPFLVLDSGLFNQNQVGGSATYEAWSQFQTYANIAFIIMFLVVLFSQLTGFGIDNYGVKKILPKLIIAAILINVSYIICQVAVDIANVVGYGVKYVFDSIGMVSLDTISLAEAQGNSAGAGGIVLGSILTALVVVITGAAILSQGTAILVPVFMAIIGIIIALFTLFCLLAVRKALAVVLVVISPLAFLCYMLPNTKKLYDKWFNAFKGTLIAFPICSAMVYGGQAVARILVLAAGSSNMPFLVALSAAVMSVAPIFMIPGAMKKSMGAISGAIDRFSRGATHRARGAAMRSSLAHDLMRRGELQRSGVRVDKDGNVQLTRRGRMQNALTRTTAGRQRLDARRADAIKTMGAATAAGTYSGANGVNKMQQMYDAGQAAQAKQRVADIESSIVNGADANNLSALGRNLEAAIMNGDTDNIKAYQNVLSSKGEKGRDEVRAAIERATAAGAGVTGAAKQQYQNGIQTFAQNLMDNHQSAYKAKDLSLYDFAKNNQSASSSGVTALSNEVNTNKLTASQMSGMDDSAFNRLVNQAGSNGVDINMQNAAQAALDSEEIGSMEQGRRDLLEQMAVGVVPTAGGSATHSYTNNKNNGNNGGNGNSNGNGNGNSNSNGGGHGSNNGNGGGNGNSNGNGNGSGSNNP